MTPEKDTYVELKRLSSDSEYFTSVFKRIEKIVSVVLYVLSNTEIGKNDLDAVSFIKDTAFTVHEMSLVALRLPISNATTGLEELQHELTCLLSTLRLGEASGIIPKNIGALIFEQIDLVQRYITNHYLSTSRSGIDIAVQNILNEKLAARKVGGDNLLRAPITRKKQVRIPAGDISTDAYLVYSQLTDRAERIKTVLEAKPNATIKDIAEIITDVSEKTIQRELNSLIEKGQVRREGERRWSKYSVQK